MDAQRQNEDDLIQEAAQLRRSVMDYENTMAQLERREDRLIWQQLRQDSILKLQSLFELPWADQINGLSTGSALPRSLKQSRRHEWVQEQKQLLSEIDKPTIDVDGSADLSEESTSDEGAPENAEELSISSIEEETAPLDVVSTSEEVVDSAEKIITEQVPKTEIGRVILEPSNEHIMPAYDKAVSLVKVEVSPINESKSLAWLIQAPSLKSAPLTQTLDSNDDPDGRTVTANLKYLLHSYSRLVDTTLLMELFKDEGTRSMSHMDIRWHVDLLFSTYLMRHGRFIAWTSEALMSHLRYNGPELIGTDLQERICTTATVTMPLESYLSCVAEQPGIMQLFSMDDLGVVGPDCKSLLLY